VNISGGINSSKSAFEVKWNYEEKLRLPDPRPRGNLENWLGLTDWILRLFRCIACHSLIGFSDGFRPSSASQATFSGLRHSGGKIRNVFLYSPICKLHFKESFVFLARHGYLT